VGTDAGTCSELTALVFQNGGFESGAAAPGWAGSGNYPQYASVTTGAARTGSYGAELNDTGVGVPGIEQKVPVSAQLVGRTVSVTAWVRLVSFPALRLLMEANTASGIHLLLDFSDTQPSVSGWQQLSAALTIPANTDHVMVKILSAVTDANGIAHADDAQLCMDGLCSPCGP
jgi:hypothetical protein